MKLLPVVLLMIFINFEQLQAQMPSRLVQGECIDESSHEYEYYACGNALDDVFKHGPGNEWSSNFEGVGAYMTIKFQRKYTINRIRLIQRRSYKELNKEIRLCFEDGTCQLVCVCNM